MAAKTRLDREYIVTGVVVDRMTQRGVAGVIVEAWDRDTKYHDMLGQAATNADGAFVIAFDSDYFGNAAPDRGADIFFRAYLDDREVLTTFERPLRNVRPGRHDMRLEIDLPQVQTGRDRISAEQAIKAVDWWRASDFRGVVTQGFDKTRTIGALAGALVGDAFRNFDFEPVRPRSTRERDIVEQPPDQARTALLQQQVEVTAVKPASTLHDRTQLRTLAEYPVRLRAGDRVTLYEENGVVKYYTRDAATRQTADEATVARLDEDVQAVKARVEAMSELRVELENARTTTAEVAAGAAAETARADRQAELLMRVQAQLEDMQRVTAAKDQQIAKLQNDITLVTRAQDALATRLGVRGGVSGPGTGTVTDRPAPPAPRPRKKPR
jgi:hypothetical protein